MTNPMGPVFISYKHSQQSLVEGLDAILRDHGVPIWRDVRDLGPDPLEQQIRDDLEDSNLSAGLVVISRDVTESPVILNLELPGLHDRWREDDEFFVVVVLCPGIDYDEAKRILAEVESVYDLSRWYMESLDEEANSGLPPGIIDVVEAVLERRIQCIHEALATDHPFNCSIDTYGPPSHQDELAMSIDWSPHFSDGFPSQKIWQARLLPALQRTVDNIQKNAPGRSLRFRGRAHLPAAFSLGHTLPVTRDIDATWMQPTQNGDREPWTFSVDAENSGLYGTFEHFEVSQSDLCVLVSVTDDVRPEVGNTKASLPEFNGRLELGIEEDMRPTLTPAQAVDAANVFQDELRSAMNRVSQTATIHLFMAVPVGLAFLFGQVTNTLPPIQTYLLDTTGKRAYEPAVRLK